MSVAIKNLYINLLDLDRDLGRLSIEAAQAHEETIISWNVDEQLYNKGINSLGQKLTPPYSESYRKYKRRRGHPSDRVTLRDQGDFHESYVIDWRLDQGEFVIGATDFKQQYLIRRYGEFIFGLTEENIDRLRERIRPDLIELIKTRLL